MLGCRSPSSLGSLKGARNSMRYSDKGWSKRPSLIVLSMFFFSKSVHMEADERVEESLKRINDVKK